MQETDIAHQEMAARLAAERGRRAADEVARQREHKDRQRIDPVPDPDRRLIDIDRRLLLAFRDENLGVVVMFRRGRGLDDIRHGGLLQRTETRVSSSPSLLITCVEQARQGSKLCRVRRISSGCFGSAMGVSMSAASKAPILPAGSRGPPFQVVGTMHW